MRIKRLDITGFKSFMERAVFSFGDGVTGIVGPNGCGKSNVVDAIRWAMGEQSAKNLRGRGMEDVIFNGSETKQPLNIAEVSLTFKIEDGDSLAPQYAGFSEVTVTRRLFRNGDSEYLINKTPCRLLDITELFMGTGIGTRAYSIIEQGRVGLIVSSKPEDRRSLIEEAAGITKYKARRKTAERKMEATQANLQRVNDIVQELERRLDTLAKQAKRAEKYKKLKGDIREMELHSASHRYLELHAEAKVLTDRLENLGTDERESLEKVRAMEAEIAAGRQALETESVELSDRAAKLHTLESQVQLDEQSLRHWSEEMTSARARLDAAIAELDALEARRAELERQVGERETEIGSFAVSWKDDEVAMAAAQEELRRTSTLQSDLSFSLDDERQAMVELATRLANHEQKLLNLARQRTDLEERRDRVLAELAEVRGEEEGLERTRTDFSKQVHEKRQLALELAERRGAEEATLAQSRSDFAENEILLIQVREELSDKRSRLESLKEIQRNYEGFDRGVRAVMQRAGEDPRANGVYGLVADVVSVEPRFEKALEAAFGERLQHVIVDHRERAFELMTELREMAEGRSSFLPLEFQRPSLPALRASADTRGFLGSALDLVKTEDALRPLVESLLTDVSFFDTLDNARAFAEYEGKAHTLVTLEGEVLRPDGSATGGALEGAAVGALQKKREVAELETDVTLVEGRYNEILTRHYSLQKQIGHTESVLKGLSKNQHAEELALASQEKDLNRASEDLAKVRDRVKQFTTEEEQLSAQLTALSSEEEQSRGEVAHGHTEKASREDRAKHLSQELEALRGRSEAGQATLTALRIKVAANSERGESARKELETLQAQLAETVSRRARLEETKGADGQKVAELEARQSETTSQKDERAEQAQRLNSELEAQRTAHGEKATRIRDEESALRELRVHVDELTQGLSQVTLKEREMALELGHLLEAIQERHGLDLKYELYKYHLLPSLPPASEAKLKDLRGQLDKMGEINVTAIEEHAEVAKRFEFLSGQKNDLEGSLEQLREAISRIDKTSRERFQATFDIINEKFQQVFPRLFGGGRASLILTNEGPGAEPGVEIVAQPPGKKLQSVNLFSGGEKALTAVSLIFAIFLIKPTPFCLLDEVDAPLDEGNVGRYNDMVKEMSKGSQFILITHNKRTMEVSDTLYGVTMEEPGISKLVSVNLKDSVAANEDEAAEETAAG